MIKLNKNQATEIRDLLLIMSRIVKINPKIFNKSIKETINKHLKTLIKQNSPLKIKSRPLKIKDNIYSVSSLQNLKKKVKGGKKRGK